MDQLSPQLTARAWNFLKAVLTFCRDILCLGENDPIPRACLVKDIEKLWDTYETYQSNVAVLLLDRLSEQEYVTVLYNDEIHSYDDVIEALTRPDVGLDQMGAVAMATNVDSMVWM